MQKREALQISSKGAKCQLIQNLNFENIVVQYFDISVSQTVKYTLDS